MRSKRPEEELERIAFLVMAAVSLAPNELRSVEPPSAAQRFGLGSGENPWLCVLGLSAGLPLSR